MKNRISKYYPDKKVAGIVNLINEISDRHEYQFPEKESVTESDVWNDCLQRMNRADLIGSIDRVFYDSLSDEDLATPTSEGEFESAEDYFELVLAKTKDGKYVKIVGYPAYTGGAKLGNTGSATFFTNAHMFLEPTNFTVVEAFLVGEAIQLLIDELEASGELS